MPEIHGEAAESPVGDGPDLGSDPIQAGGFGGVGTVPADVLGSDPFQAGGFGGVGIVPA